MASDSAGSETAELAVVFVDIVGFTSRSKELTEGELVQWIEYFEAECSGLVTDHGGRVIKNIGDEVLFVADDVAAAAAAALTMTDRGADQDDDFPQVRAGMAYGDVVARLGDVFGPTVNIASRLTSLARPCSVLVDRGAHEALDRPDEPAGEGAGFRFRKLRRTSVKGYERLESWVLRRTED
jgi:adenylate cyclase